MAKKVLPVKSPDYTWKIMNNFPLRNLEKIFTIADFERPLRKRHVRNIVISMLNNEFYNNVLSVFIKRNGQFEIIDGQHRIEGLGKIRDEHGVTHYNLALMIFPERISRRIYRRINLGAPLRMEEHLRALDNGKHPFFTRLRPYFLHYNDGNFPKFEMILSALSYAKNGSPRAVRALLLDRLFSNITSGDLDSIIQFGRAINKIEPFIPKTRQPLYLFQVYRNMFRVGYENSFDQKIWEQLITEVRTDKVIQELVKDVKFESVRRIYSYMVGQLADRMHWELKKIERTGVQARLVLNESKGPFQYIDT